MKKLKVDKNSCIGCGYCFNQYQDLFSADSDGLSQVIQEFVDDDNASAINAVEGCPTSAISLEDANEEKCCQNDGECCCKGNCDHQE